MRRVGEHRNFGDCIIQGGLAISMVRVRCAI